MQYFTILQHKLQSFNIQDDRSTRGLLAKSLKKFPKSHIQPAGSHFCSANCSECLNEHTRVNLQRNKEIIMFIFYLMVLSMCNQRLIRAAFLVCQLEGLYGSLKGNKQNMYDLNLRVKNITKMHDSKDRTVAFTL